MEQASLPIQYREGKFFSVKVCCCGRVGKRHPCHTTDPCRRDVLPFLGSDVTRGISHYYCNAVRKFLQLGLLIHLPTPPYPPPPQLRYLSPTTQCHIGPQSPALDFAKLQILPVGAARRTRGGSWKKRQEGRKGGPPSSPLGGGAAHPCSPTRMPRQRGAEARLRRRRVRPRRPCTGVGPSCLGQPVQPDSREARERKPLEVRPQ